MENAVDVQGLAANMVPYTNFVHGIQIQYPSEWETQEQTTGGNYALVFMSPPEDETDWFRENVNILVEPLPPGFTLEQYVKATAETFAKMGVKFQQSNLSSLGGVPAYNLVYSMALSPDAPSPGKFYQFMAVKNGNGYVFTYTAQIERFEKFLPVVKAMVQTLRIK